jgi:hypothetical protein
MHEIAKDFSKTIKKKKRSIDVIFVVQIRVDREKIIKHMFITMILYLSIEQKTIRVMSRDVTTHNIEDCESRVLMIKRSQK